MGMQTITERSEGGSYKQNEKNSVDSVLAQAW